MSPELNTRNTQIYINLGDNTRNDAEPFAIFGQVVEGMDVLDRLYSGYGEQSGSGVRQGRPGSDRRRRKRVPGPGVPTARSDRRATLVSRPGR